LPVPDDHTAFSNPDNPNKIDSDGEAETRIDRNDDSSFCESGSHAFDVIGVGSLVVDIFCNTPYSLVEFKGEMQESFTLVPVGLKTSTQLEVHSGGSSGNGIAYLSRLGLKCGYFTKLGEDMFSDFLLKDLYLRGIDNSHIIRDKKFIGGAAIIMVASGRKGHALLVSHGSAEHLTINDVKRNLNYLCSAKWLYISSITGDSGITALQYLVNQAKRRKVKIFFAPSTTMISQYRKEVLEICMKSDVLAMNIDEFRILSRQDVKNTLLELHKHGVGKVFLTFGQKGVMASDGSFLYRINAYKVPNNNPTGAGDTAAALFLYGIIKNLDLKKTLNMAVLAGAKHVASKNTGAKNGNPHLSWLFDYLEKHRDLPVHTLPLHSKEVNKYTEPE